MEYGLLTCLQIRIIKTGGRLERYAIRLGIQLGEVTVTGASRAKGLPTTERLGRRQEVPGYYAWQDGSCSMKAGLYSALSLISPLRKCPTFAGCQQ